MRYVLARGLGRSCWEPANLSNRTNKIIAIAHNAKAFDLQFILKAILLKWKPELIMNGLKIMCMKMEHLVFLDSVLPPVSSA